MLQWAKCAFLLFGSDILDRHYRLFLFRKCQFLPSLSANVFSESLATENILSFFINNSSANPHFLFFFFFFSKNSYKIVEFSFHSNGISFSYVSSQLRDIKIWMTKRQFNWFIRLWLTLFFNQSRLVLTSFKITGIRCIVRSNWWIIVILKLIVIVIIKV